MSKRPIETLLDDGHVLIDLTFSDTEPGYEEEVITDKEHHAATTGIKREDLEFNFEPYPENTTKNHQWNTTPNNPEQKPTNNRSAWDSSTIHEWSATVTEETQEAHPSSPQSKPPKYPPPPYKASIKSLADTSTSSTPQPSKPGTTPKVETAILERIQKCLTRGLHPNTPEAEAKTALFMASRLMKAQNITQAEVFASTTSSSENQTNTYGGQSTTIITRSDGDKTKRVQNQGFMTDIIAALRNFFDCKAYTYASKSSGYVGITFYGIAENTVAAAMACEMVYNLIAEWSRPFKGVAGKNSYCLGIARELYVASWKERREEEKRAAGGREKKTEDGDGDEPQWESQMQLTTFRNSAEQIADAFLKDQGMKLKKGRKRENLVRDREAYEMGKKDSVLIDVRRKRVKHE